MKWRDDLTADLKPIFGEGSDEAISVVLSLVGAVRTAEAVLGEKTDRDTRVGMAQLLLDFTISLPSNPFWIRHGAYIMPVYATAIAAWMDSYNYAESDSVTDRVAFITSRNVLGEVAGAVLYCHRGGKAVLDKGRDLRTIMIKHGDFAAREA